MNPGEEHCENMANRTIFGVPSIHADHIHAENMTRKWASMLDLELISLSPKEPHTLLIYTM
jgi:hypothetical protein